MTFLPWASFHHVIGAKTYCIFNGLVSVAIVTSGSLSNDDGDINENCLRAEQKVKMSKTTPLHVHHAFLYISFPSLHDYDVKMPIFTFC